MMNEEERVKVLKGLNIPDHLIETYLYILFEDKNLIPKHWFLKDNRTVSKKKMKKDISDCIVLFGWILLSQNRSGIDD